jgi:hypothetical protein
MIISGNVAREAALIFERILFHNDIPRSHTRLAYQSVARDQEKGYEGRGVL